MRSKWTGRRLSKFPKPARSSSRKPKLNKRICDTNHLLPTAKALGGSAVREVVGVKKRVLSSAGRAAVVKAAKKRWAKVRRQAKKVA
jgi:hypothetical protein